MLEEGDRFYFSDPKQLRGLHFTVINKHSDDCSTEYDLVDTSRRKWDVVEGDDDLLVGESDSVLSLEVPKENVIITHY